MQKPKYTYFFNKQPGYKQLALKWQIAKQLSGINSLSVSNNKNYRLKKSRVFPLCNKHKTAVRPTILTKIQLPQKHYWKNFNF